MKPVAIMLIAICLGGCAREYAAANLSPAEEARAQCNTELHHVGSGFDWDPLVFIPMDECMKGKGFLPVKDKT